MARADLLISLVRAGASGDRSLLKSAVDSLTAEERAKSHHVLADRLQRAFANSVNVSSPSLTGNRGLGKDGRDAILELTPRLRLDELILTLPVRQQAKQLVEEHVRADLLRAHGMEPRHRLLLSGPPGNGKTSFAEGIAEALGLPFYVIRYDVLIGSYLGETNTRLRSLFEYVKTVPCVLFFDEFDVVGKERGDTHETGEIKRVVSFMLMQLDQLPSYVIAIAASNHAELLDRAVWRRFQLRLDFPAPDRAHLAEFIARIVESWPQRPKMTASAIAGKLGSVSYAEALDFCQNIRRREILSHGELDVDSVIRQELDHWLSRVTAESIKNGRSDKAASSSGSRAAKTKRNR